MLPEKGYKSRAQRRAEEESRAAAEEEAKRQEAELLRFKARLTEGQRQWIRQEARRLVESPLYLHQLGRPVPGAPVEGYGTSAFLGDPVRAPGARDFFSARSTPGRLQPSRRLPSGGASAQGKAAFAFWPAASPGPQSPLCLEGGMDDIGADSPK